MEPADSGWYGAFVSICLPEAFDDTGCAAASVHL